MNNQLTLGEYISQVFFKETGQDKLVLAINMDLTIEQVSLLLEDKLELSSDHILRLSKILPISLAEIHSRLLLTYQGQTTLPVLYYEHRDKTILEHQIKHTLNYTTNNMYLCKPLTILHSLNYDIKEAYSKFGHSIFFDVFLKGNVIHITTQYSVKNTYSRAKQFTSMFTPNRSSEGGSFIVVRNEHVDFSEIAKKHNTLNTFILDAYIVRNKLHVDSLLHIFRHNRTKLNKFIEGKLKLDTSELIALENTISIPFELLKDLQMRAGDKQTPVNKNSDFFNYWVSDSGELPCIVFTRKKTDDNQQRGMKMNKINAALKALLDGLGILVSDEQKKTIQEHMEKSIKDGVNKHAREELDNAMKAMHLRPSEEAKMSKNVEKAHSLVRAISDSLTAVDEKISNSEVKMVYSITSLKDLVEKRREEELVKSISKVKTLIKKDTTTINKLTDKRVNLTANLFNLEDKLAKLRNSNKSK